VRLFVALYPPHRAVRDLVTVVHQLNLGQPAEPGHSLRLQPPERWHLTIAFLGEVPDDRAPVAAQALDQAVTRWCADTAVHPSVHLTGGGRFGRGRFTVVWVGLAGDLDPLRTLAHQVRRELRHARLPVDGKGFNPHLTLARPGDRITPDALEADLSTLTSYSGPTWSPAALTLVRSHPGPQPRYDPVATTPLHRA